MNRLFIFYKIVVCGNQKAAAADLGHESNTVVWNNINRLEEDIIGTPLFETYKGKRLNVLTEYGRVLFDQIKDPMKELERVMYG